MGSGGLGGVSAEYPPRACLGSVQKVVCSWRGRDPRPWSETIWVEGKR